MNHFYVAAVLAFVGPWAHAGDREFETKSTFMAGAASGKLVEWAGFRPNDETCNRQSGVVNRSILTVLADGYAEPSKEQFCRVEVEARAASAVCAVYVYTMAKAGLSNVKVTRDGPMRGPRDVTISDQLNKFRNICAKDPAYSKAFATFLDDFATALEPYVVTKTMEMREKYRKEYRAAFAAAHSRKQLTAFVEAYKADDPEGLATEAQKRLDSPELLATEAQQARDSARINAELFLRDCEYSRRALKHEQRIREISGVVNLDLSYALGAVIAGCEARESAVYEDYKKNGGTLTRDQIAGAGG